MSSEHSENPVGEDVLSALRADGRIEAPEGARARVFARLSAGVAAAGATVALPSAAAATVGKVTGSSAASAAGGALGFGVVKALVVQPLTGAMAGLALASGVAYVALEPNPSLKPLPAARAPAPRPVEPFDPVAPPAAPPSAAGEAETRSEPAVPTPNARAAAETTLIPGPELPANAAARLAEQQALLDEARASLRRGDGARALTIVREHERRHPATAFAEEREAIGILALVMVGRAPEARSRADAFERRHPKSLFLASIRSALARHDPAPNGL